MLGLAGKDEWEEAKASEVTHLFDEMANSVTPYVGAKFGLYSGDVVSVSLNKVDSGYKPTRI